MLTFVGLFIWIIGRSGFPISAGKTLVLLAFLVVPTAATFLATNRLAKAIRALRDSTEAILAGDFSRPVEVDCNCEVGGLADSFRAMVGRLNNNILRMNVLAYTDQITGLPNRAVISHALTVLRHAREDGRWQGHASLLFIDLDGFKRVNDTLGHETGDELLRRVADRIIIDGLAVDRDGIDDCATGFGELSEAVPERPVLVRFAGDEFVVLFPYMLEEMALEEVAGRIIGALSAPFLVQDNEVSVGASIGIARAPDDSVDPERLLTCADLAMYAAKDAGKGKFRFFDRGLEQLAENRVRIEIELRKGIEHDELGLQFQPKLDTRNLALQGVEALLRWNNPDRGEVGPDSFIAIAEQSGLMPELGTRVLDLAVRQARSWADAGYAIPVAINMSATQFERPRLVDEVLTVLYRHKVAPSLLEIEVTETMVMSNFTASKDRMEKLRAAGVILSIDDFGTGYSNLAKLSSLPFHQLKIDRALIKDIGQNPKSEAILEAVIKMAHSLGYKVVAEGIEEQHQHDFLLAQGCDRVQGFLYGAAMAPSSLLEWHIAMGGAERLLVHKVPRARVSA